jgi:hypothetical protein
VRLAYFYLVYLTANIMSFVRLLGFDEDAKEVNRPIVYQ